MKKVVVIILNIMLVMAMAFVFTGCGNNTQTEEFDSNISQSQNVLYGNTEYEKILKVELGKEDGKAYEEYDYYIYYYFKNDKMITEDSVYIFDSEIHAQQWYDSHIQTLQDATLSKLIGNTVVDSKIDSKYVNSNYEDVLKMVKDNTSIISYTQE